MPCGHQWGHHDPLKVATGHDGPPESLSKKVTDGEPGGQPLHCHDLHKYAALPDLILLSTPPEALRPAAGSGCTVTTMQPGDT